MDRKTQAKTNRQRAELLAKPIPCEKLGHKKCRVTFNVDGTISHRIDGKDKREHLIVYEQHHKCCLLTNANIRHINGINWDNRVRNLRLLTRRDKANNFGKWAEPIPSDRECVRCGSPKTKIEDDGRPHWLRGPASTLADTSATPVTV